MNAKRIIVPLGLVIVFASLGGFARSALSASNGVRPGVAADSTLKSTIVLWATRLQQDATAVDLQCASCLQTGGHTVMLDAGQAARAVKSARPATRTGTRARILAVKAFNGFAATGQQLVTSGQAAAQSRVAAAVGQAKLSAHLAAQAAKSLAQARVAAQNAGARVVSADHLIPIVSGVIPPFDLHITAISSGAPKIYTGDTLTVTYRLHNGWDQALGGRTTAEVDGMPIAAGLAAPFDSDVPLAAKTSRTFQIKLDPYDNDKPGTRSLTIAFWQVSLVAAPRSRAATAGLFPVVLKKTLLASDTKRFVAEEGAILTTDTEVPTAPHSSSICAGRTFPDLGGQAPRYEWASVLPGGYQTAVSGTALFPYLASARLPFTHPFGITPGVAPSGHPILSDFNFSVAVGSQYSGLLADSNIHPTSLELAKAKAAAPNSAGVLGVGFDQNLLPRAYRPHNGDSVVLLGDWIVNCGKSDFHTEIHPPLLLVTARHGGSAPAGTTVSSIIGRPYRVDQEFREDDQVSRHGFMEHLHGELSHWARTVFRSNVAALAHLSEKPFSGKRTLRYFVAPPTHRQTKADKLIVHYDLTVRGGVTARVSIPPGDPDHAEVVVTLNEAAYQGAPPPKQHDCRYNLKALGFNPAYLKLSVLHWFALIGVPPELVAAILDVDIFTTCYDPLPAAPLTLPKGQDIQVDDSLPYPIYGVVTAEWQRGGVPPTVTKVPPPTVSVGDVSVVEGNAGLSSAMVHVSLSAASSRPVSVRWATGDGSARAGSDYVAASGTVIFPAGVTSQNVSVSVVGDSVVEPDETFAVQLSSPVNATIADGTATVTIVNDDKPPVPLPPPPPPPPAMTTPTLSINDVSLVEGDTGTTDAVFTVSLSASSTSGVSVAYQTQDGSAQAGSDYAARSGTLTFSPGETSKQVSVAVNGDTTVEPDETFTVALSNPANVTLSRATGTATIVNDDSAAPPPPPPLLPDLIVQSIDSLGPNGEVFTVCKVTFTVKNQGAGSAGPSTARVYTPTGISTVAIADVSTPALASGQSVQESGVLNTSCGNIGYLTVTADSTGAVSESDESNNRKEGP